MPLRLIVNYGMDYLLDPQQDSPMSGGKTAILALCTELARRGHDVHVFAKCPRPGRQEAVDFHDRGDLNRWSTRRGSVSGWSEIRSGSSTPERVPRSRDARLDQSSPGISEA
jgi:hypothetical protein